MTAGDRPVACDRPGDLRRADRAHDAAIARTATVASRPTHEAGATARPLRAVPVSPRAAERRQQRVCRPSPVGSIHRPCLRRRQVARADRGIGPRACTPPAARVLTPEALRLRPESRDRSPPATASRAGPVVERDDLRPVPDHRRPALPRARRPTSRSPALERAQHVPTPTRCPHTSARGAAALPDPALVRSSSRQGLACQPEHDVVDRGCFDAASDLTFDPPPPARRPRRSSVEISRARRRRDRAGAAPGRASPSTAFACLRGLVRPLPQGRRARLPAAAASARRPRRPQAERRVAGRRRSPRATCATCPRLPYVVVYGKDGETRRRGRRAATWPALDRAIDEGGAAMRRAAGGAARAGRSALVARSTVPPHACAGCRTPSFPITRRRDTSSCGSARAARQRDRHRDHRQRRARAGCADLANCAEVPVQPPLPARPGHLPGGAARGRRARACRGSWALEVPASRSGSRRAADPVRDAAATLYVPPDRRRPPPPRDARRHRRSRGCSDARHAAARRARHRCAPASRCRSGAPQENPFTLGRRRAAPPAHPVRHRHVRSGGGSPTRRSGFGAVCGWRPTCRARSSLYQNSHGFRAPGRGYRRRAGWERALFGRLIGAIGPDLLLRGTPSAGTACIRQDGNLRARPEIADRHRAQPHLRRQPADPAWSASPLYRHIVAGERGAGPPVVAR